VPQTDQRGDLIRAENFILATRDTGYRSTSYALAELVDNSIQAGATRIETFVAPTGDAECPLELTIVDNGCGMNPTELRRALAFGGTSRFDDRTSLGRYGMGLPNGALSLARKLTVYSWRPGKALVAELVASSEADGRARGEALAPFGPLNRGRSGDGTLPAHADPVHIQRTPASPRSCWRTRSPSRTSATGS
jgi:anti-sigma regulatory factor (Ser/Thr protein kinase)